MLLKILLLLTAIQTLALAGDNDTLLLENNATFEVPNNLTIMNYTITIEDNTTTLNTTSNSTLQGLTITLVETDWLATLITTTTEIISDNAGALLASIATIWLFIWKRNKLFAGIGITATGLSMELLTTTSGTFGWVIAGAGILTIAYETLKATEKVK